MRQAVKMPVLMYHATFGDSSPLEAVATSDRPYAVSESHFMSHVDALIAGGYSIVPERSVFEPCEDAHQPLLMTFDDGHVSNHAFVTPLLAERNLSALFFITTDWVDQREHYCSTAALREMCAAGMTLGSHGCSHEFIADMSPGAARNELTSSKEKLEDMIGQQIETVSFPGGRCGLRDIDLAFEAGYTAVFGSEFGLHLVGRERVLIERLPVRRGMQSDTVLAMCDPRSAYHRKLRVATTLKSTAKRIFGNGVYDAIYRRFAA